MQFSVVGSHFCCSRCCRCMMRDGAMCNQRVKWSFVQLPTFVSDSITNIPIMCIYYYLFGISLDFFIFNIFPVQPIYPGIYAE